jgi:hypothetical protein
MAKELMSATIKEYLQYLRGLHPPDIKNVAGTRTSFCTFTTRQWALPCPSSLAKNMVVGSHIYEFFIAANKIDAIKGIFP